MSEFESMRAQLPASIMRGDVEKVLRAVMSEREPWEWFTWARIPFPSAVAILRALRDGNFLQSEHLTERGAALARELYVQAAPDLRCRNCMGSGTDWLALEKVYLRYLKIFEGRPRGEDPELDQGAMTPESLFRRLALMLQQGDVAGKNIAILGDDDLASVALALTGLPASVTVFEIDARICEYIATLARENNLDIRVVQQDLTRQLPRELLGTFDTFVCDPPETEAGLLLFVEKGLGLLRAGDAHAGYFGATVMEASLSKWKRWQMRLLQNHEIAFTHILPPFTEYESWPDEKPISDLLPLAHIAARPWYRFAFYRLETLPNFQPAQDFETELSKIFYFDEESYYEAFNG